MWPSLSSAKTGDSFCLLLDAEMHFFVRDPRAKFKLWLHFMISYLSLQQAPRRVDPNPRHRLTARARSLRSGLGPLTRRLQSLRCSNMRSCRISSLVRVPYSSSWPDSLSFAIGRGATSKTSLGTTLSPSPGKGFCKGSHSAALVPWDIEQRQRLH